MLHAVHEALGPSDDQPESDKQLQEDRGKVLGDP